MVSTKLNNKIIFGIVLSMIVESRDEKMKLST